MTEWISVRGRLPEGDGELYGAAFEQSNIVILYGKDPCGRIAFGIGRWIYDHMNTKDSGWNGVMGDDWEAYLCTVTHWMPLPEPPKEEA